VSLRLVVCAGRPWADDLWPTPTPMMVASSRCLRVALNLRFVLFFIDDAVFYDMLF
jgi:hypothetical protein